MYGYIYLTTNLINGKKYIGQHKSNKSKIVGRHWYNNGAIEIMAYECPEGYSEGRLY